MRVLAAHGGILGLVGALVFIPMWITDSSVISSGVSVMAAAPTEELDAPAVHSLLTGAGMQSNLAPAVKVANDNPPKLVRGEDKTTTTTTISATTTTPATSTTAAASRTARLSGVGDVAYGFAEQQGLTGGQGRNNYVVTSDANSGPGTYRDALSLGDRYITFAPGLEGATIKLSSSVTASGSNLTLDGSGVGITVTGFATKFSGTNVIVAGMAYRQMTGSTNEDAITFRNASTTQVFGVYGSVFETATDGLIDVIWNRGNDVYGTICGNEFLRHDKGMLVHSGDPTKEGGSYHITLCQNSWSDVYQRAPFSRDALVHQYNDVFQDYGKADGAGGGSKSGVDGFASEHFLQNNVAVPRLTGSVTWKGELVVRPRTEFAGPHASSMGNVRIEGSLLLTTGDRTASEKQNNPDKVFTPTYDPRVVPASDTMRQAVERAAGSCDVIAESGVLANPCAATTFVASGGAIQYITDGAPVSVEIFFNGRSIGSATAQQNGRWSYVVGLAKGTIGQVSAVVTNADGSTVTAPASLIAVV